LIIAGTMRSHTGLPLNLASLSLLALIHGSTVFVQVPAHGRLTGGFDLAVVRRLVRTNWIRTVGWTARTVAAASMVVVAT
jgi:hypothetical protein